jgi:hypothetical protein
MMKRFYFYLVLFVFSFPTIGAQNIFDSLFHSKTLRLDCMMAGTSTQTSLFLLAMKQQPVWGGPRKTLVDDLDFGKYRVLLLSESKRDTLYLRGFSTLFEEWQTTIEAKTVSRAFPLAVTVPYPKSDGWALVEKRSKAGTWDQLLSVWVDVDSPAIIRDEPKPVVSKLLVNNGNAADCVDLVFLAEGYTAAQMDKFYGDVARMSNYLLGVEPFAKMKNRINIWAVASPSLQSGPDDPNKQVWRQTAFNTSFNTFGTDRYLETFDLFAIHDALANVPCDHPIVLVNTSKYGGGGVYNSCSVASADDRLSNIVFVHELGHGLGGLGDEYYNSDVAYSDYFDLAVEPWEPNLTTMVNFDKKWRHMMSADTPVPTPEETEYKNTIGVFEGGGYVAKGVFRPAMECRMKSNEPKAFCKVCQWNIEKVIKSLTE